MCPLFASDNINNYGAGQTYGYIKTQYLYETADLKAPT
jgi:hypothetical protein